MKLLEFFGVPTNDENSSKPSADDLTGKTQEEQEKIADELFWFMLDDDGLHKKYFIPLAQELARQIKAETVNRREFVPKWMPMVNQACLKFYKAKEMKDDPRDAFTFEMRKGLCRRLADHVYDDIEKGEYNLGI